MKNFEFPLSCGLMASLKPRCRSTALSRFEENHPTAIEAVMAIVPVAGSLKIDESAAKLFLRGLSSSDTEAVLSFLVDQIEEFVTPEGVEVDEDWGRLDWRGMDKEQRQEALDLLLSTLDLISMFIGAWAHYQGVGARPRRG